MTMNFVKTILPLFVCLSFFSVEANTQNYQTAAGLRLGYPLSVSIKHFITPEGALEGYAGARWYSNRSWRNLSLAYQHHFDLEGVDGLQWYAGVGASIYFWTYDFKTEASNSNIGLQGYLGLDYTFADAPFSVTLDWVPTIFVNGYSSGFGGRYGSLGVRYILAR